LVEAQSCGKPVIAGNSGGTRETFIEGETGIIVDATDAQSIAKAVTQLLCADKTLLEMGEKGRVHVINSLDWKALARQAYTLFK
jgi:phosphatidylinositol alpha-1,6-mannosyltransferase